MNNWMDHWNEKADGEKSLHVRWIINPGQEPLRNVRLTVSHSRIVDLTPLPESQASRALPLTLIPSLVNAHTHLEFSGLPAPLQPVSPFTDWIRAVIRYRQEAMNLTPTSPSIRRGIQESLANGVGAIGEITTSDVLHSLQGSAAAVVSFRECIGLKPEQMDAQVALAARHLAAAREAGVLPGVSPHAPYSVHPDLLTAIVELAQSENVPLAMHLAESKEEMQLLQEGNGPFADLLDARGLWNPEVFPGRRSILSILVSLAKLPRVLVIHGNYLNSDELHFVVSHPNITVVYCPRTHHYFGHPRHPWLDLLKSGGSVALGTDSRASNPDLSIWKELQFVATLEPAVPVSELLKMVTTSAARALNLDPVRFTLTPGQRFTGVFLQCSDQAASHIERWVRGDGTYPVAIADGSVIHPRSAMPSS